LVMLWQDTLIGIDLGAWSVKAVILSGSRGSYRLKAAAYMKLPKEARDGDLGAEALASFLRSNGIKGGKASVLMTGHSLMFRHFFLPEMPEKDLLEAVKWEIRKEVSIAPSELVSDFVLAAGGAAEHKSSIIAFAGVKKEIDSILSYYREAGVDARVIEVVPTALLASFDANNAWEDGLNYAILDIGYSKSTLAIFKKKRLAFTREISMGGQEFTRAAQKATQKGTEEAEEFKHSAGHGEAMSVFPAAIERLSTEVHRSFDYYQAQYREGGVDKLFLSGGSALLKGLDSALSASIGIHVFIDDPFRKIKLPHREEGLTGLSPCFSVAMGLALRAGA